MKINRRLAVTAMSAMLGLSMTVTAVSPLAVWAENSFVFLDDTEENKDKEAIAIKEKKLETKTEDSDSTFTLDMLVEGEEFKAFFDSADDAATASEIYGLTLVNYDAETRKATFTKELANIDEVLKLIQDFNEKGLTANLKEKETTTDNTEETNTNEDPQEGLENTQENSIIDELVGGEEFKAYFDSEEEAKEAAEKYGLTFVKYYGKTGKATFTKEITSIEDINTIIEAFKDDEHALDLNKSNEEDLYDEDWYEEKIRELEELNAKLETKVVDLESFVDTLTAKNAENEKSKTNLEAQIKTLNNQVASLKNKSDKELQDAIAVLEKTLKSRQDEKNKQLEAAISKNNSTLSNLRSSSTSSADLSSVNSKLNTLSATTSSLSSKLNSTTSDINSLKSEVNNLKNNDKNETKNENVDLDKNDYEEPDEEEISLEPEEEVKSNVSLDEPNTVKQEDIITYPNAYNQGGAGNFNVDNQQQVSNVDDTHKRIEENPTAKSDGQEKKNYGGLIGGFVALLCAVGIGGYFANKKFHFIGGNGYSEDISDDDYFTDEDYNDSENESYGLNEEVNIEGDDEEEAEAVTYEDEGNMVMEKIA